MGSPSATLNIPAHLLPWHQAGVRQFLGSRPASGTRSQAGPQPTASRLQAAWPAPWDRCWSKVPENARIVWTYLDLGRDLCGAGDKARGGLFRSLLGHLNWPKGTTAFWPLCCPDGGCMLTRQDLFWDGIAILDVKHVACFGADALSLLLPGADPDAAQTQRGPVTVHVFPSPAELLRLLPHDRHLAVDRLKALRF